MCKFIRSRSALDKKKRCQTYYNGLTIIKRSMADIVYYRAVKNIAKVLCHKNLSVAAINFCEHIKLRM